MSQPSITVSNGETIANGVFDFSKELELHRLPEYQYALGEFVRAENFDGFVYECTNAGKTIGSEPDWPAVVGAIVNDGSVEWTCRDFSDSGSDTISTVTVTPGSGLTVNSAVADKSTRVNVSFTAAAVGRTELLCSIVTAAGQTLKQVLKVVVK